MTCDGSLTHWREVNLGRFLAREHDALADASLAEEARKVLAGGDAIRGELRGAALNGPAELAAQVVERIGDVS